MQKKYSIAAGVHRVPLAYFVQKPRVGWFAWPRDLAMNSDMEEMGVGSVYRCERVIKSTLTQRTVHGEIGKGRLTYCFK